MLKKSRVTVCIHYIWKTGYLENIVANGTSSNCLCSCTWSGKRVRGCCIILENNTSNHRGSSKVENSLNVIIDNYDNYVTNILVITIPYCHHVTPEINSLRKNPSNDLNWGTNKDIDMSICPSHAAWYKGVKIRKIIWRQFHVIVP